MSDQGLWFKLWVSCLDDPLLDNLSLEDFGRWCKLGAFVRRHGVEGVVSIEPPARALCAMFQVPDYETLVSSLSALPGVVRANVTLETIASFQFRNWARFQGDWSTPRVRKMRSMKHHIREEKRREENSPLPQQQADRGLRLRSRGPTRVKADLTAALDSLASVNGKTAAELRREAQALKAAGEEDPPF